MLLIHILTLLLSTQYVLDLSTKPNGNDITWRCCSCAFTNNSLAFPRKLMTFSTSIDAVPAKCFASGLMLLPQYNKTNATNAASKVVAKSASQRLSIVIHHESEPTTVRRIYSNTSSLPTQTINEERIKSQSRDEFQTMKRFHFGREVPVLEIFVCVTFYCVLIAVSCVFLHFEDDYYEDNEEVERLEDLRYHCKQLKNSETQTCSTDTVQLVDQSVQTVPTNELSFEEVQANYFEQSRQSDC
ncbi:hypothetical protein DICVIV_03358 [Dictyocaulus viviparus]|uniref:Uncharacterized protein n=1 Tax=Dictyocaulus viviparus TaxID=29172 RepID=A0A0D8Y0W0_DICVI|nr:hypothetical protein DICVIV_03358 [Dictyocaulus viviparus]